LREVFDDRQGNEGGRSEKSFGFFEMTLSSERVRSRLSDYLENLNETPGKIINGSLAVLVLLSAVIFVAETYPLPESIRSALQSINTGILIVFSVEYLLRLWSAEQKWRYVVSPYSIIDLVAIVPFFVGSVHTSFVLVLRWVRILKLLRFIKGRTIIGYVSSEDGVILTRILFSLFAIVFIYSGLIYQVEHPSNGEKFRTFLDALYFAVATMTTVGFGDITPESETGRLLTILMIWTGIIVIPWQVGDLVKHLVKGAKQVKTPCLSCGTEFHDGDAKFCRVCGLSFEKDDEEGEAAIDSDPPVDETLNPDVPLNNP